jgi:ElaB/YqjD/DUF883 family membrane-anchored ribosome-binding protein
MINKEQALKKLKELKTTTEIKVKECDKKVVNFIKANPRKAVAKAAIIGSLIGLAAGLLCKRCKK